MRTRILTDEEVAKAVAEAWERVRAETDLRIHDLVRFLREEAGTSEALAAVNAAYGDRVDANLLRAMMFDRAADGVERLDHPAVKAVLRGLKEKAAA